MSQEVPQATLSPSDMIATCSNGRQDVLAYTKPTAAEVVIDVCRLHHLHAILIQCNVENLFHGKFKLPPGPCQQSLMQHDSLLRRHSCCLYLIRENVCFVNVMRDQEDGEIRFSLQQNFPQCPSADRINTCTKLSLLSFSPFLHLDEYS